MNPPILFIHYGPASYLRWTLRCAKATNPEKRIILLGDSSNRRFVPEAVEFFPFEEFSSGEKHSRFQEVFQVIQGERHRFTKHGGMEFWLEFVFRRWFLIEEFLRRENIDAFWTFDSDTLVLAPLGPVENRFQDVEATTQCRDACLNGWIGSRSLVERYTACMLDLFSDLPFLNAQRERLRIHAGLAFNEMDAFCEFRRREGVRTRRASEIIDGRAFDDALAFVDDYEPAPEKILGKTPVKRLWTSLQGGVWAKADGEFVRLLTCNMSWMPDYLWKKILRCGKVGLPVGRAGFPPVPGRRLIDLREPLRERLIREGSIFCWRVRRALQEARSQKVLSKQ